MIRDLQGTIPDSCQSVSRLQPVAVAVLDEDRAAEIAEGLRFQQVSSPNPEMTLSLFHQQHIGSNYLNPASFCNISEEQPRYMSRTYEVCDDLVPLELFSTSNVVSPRFLRSR